MRPVLFALILSTTTLGCGSKKEKAPETTERAPNAKPANDHAADDKATEDLLDAQDKEAKATEAKAAADARAVTAHKVTQDQAQASFDASARRLNALKEKVAKLTGVKKEATAAVAVASSHEATVMASIAKLREADLARWDTAKAQVESDTVAFNKSIDAVEATLQ